MLNNERPKRILIVDDDPDITLFFRIALESCGFHVDVYNDPLAVLSNFKSKFFDLILLDIRMPRLNGFQLFQRIRKRDPQLRVCFMTAFEVYWKALSEEHQMVNTTCFMKKPIEAKELISRVKKELNIVD